MCVFVLKGFVLFGNDYGCDFKIVKVFFSCLILCVIIVFMY